MTSLLGFGCKLANSGPGGPQGWALKVHGQLQSSSFLVMTYFLLRDYNILPKKELPFEPLGRFMLRSSWITWGGARGSPMRILQSMISGIPLVLLRGNQPGKPSSPH